MIERVSSILRKMGFGSQLELPAEGLTRGWQSVRLDRVGSVSGLMHLETDWDDAVIDEQYRRFLHG